jgi:hypothetical protein
MHFQPNKNYIATGLNYHTTYEETESEAKHTKESEHWLNQTSTSNHYTALLEEGSENQQQKVGPDSLCIVQLPKHCIFSMLILKLRGLRPQANYTDQATAYCRRS